MNRSMGSREGGWAGEDAGRLGGARDCHMGAPLPTEPSDLSRTGGRLPGASGVRALAPVQCHTRLGGPSGQIHISEPVVTPAKSTPFPPREKGAQLHTVGDLEAGCPPSQQHWLPEPKQGRDGLWGFYCTCPGLSQTDSLHSALADAKTSSRGQEALPALAEPSTGHTVGA